MRAAGTPIAAAATRAASIWASARLAPPTSALERPGQERGLAFPLVGLLRAAALARRQLGDGGAGEEQRREQQPHARVRGLEVGRREQRRVEHRDGRGRGEDARAQTEEERLADHRRQVDEAERLVVRPQRAVQRRDHARADRDGERAQHERGERIAAGADAGAVAGGESGYPARATGQRHAPSVLRAAKPAGNHPIVEPKLPGDAGGGRRSKRYETSRRALDRGLGPLRRRLERSCG